MPKFDPTSSRDNSLGPGTLAPAALVRRGTIQQPKPSLGLFYQVPKNGCWLRQETRREIHRSK